MHIYNTFISTTQNKSLNHLVSLLINCISARFVPKIFFIKDDCTFLFSDFLIIGLCNFSPNSLLEIISSLTALSEIFYQKIYRPLNQVHVDIHHILDF